MERTKLLTVAVIGLLVLNLITIGFLILKPGGPLHRGGKQPSAVIMERLHFDDRQQEQYQKQIRAHQEQTRRLNEQSVELYRQYYGLLKANQPDTTQANLISRQIGDIQRTLARVNFSHFQEIRALCHPDQQADFSRLVDELSRLFGQQQRPERPGPGGPPQGPPGDRPDGPPGNLPPRP